MISTSDGVPRGGPEYIAYTQWPTREAWEQAKRRCRSSISYLGDEKPSSPEEGKQQFSKYMDWLASLGGSAVSPANPLKDTRTVGADGTVTTGGTTSMSGFTVIEVDSMEAALEIAKACLFLETGGSLEVSEPMQMPGQK